MSLLSSLGQERSMAAMRSSMFIAGHDRVTYPVTVWRGGRSESEESDEHES